MRVSCDDQRNAFPNERDCLSFIVLLAKFIKPTKFLTPEFQVVLILRSTTNNSSRPFNCVIVNLNIKKPIPRFRALIPHVKWYNVQYLFQRIRQCSLLDTDTILILVTKIPFFYVDFDQQVLEICIFFFTFHLCRFYS